MRLLRVVIAASLIFVITACGNKNTESQAQAEAEKRRTEEIRLAQAQAEKAAKEKERADCLSTLDDLKQEYRQHLAAHKYWDAARAIRACATILNDETLKSLLEPAEIQGYTEMIKDQKSDLHSRIMAVDMFAKDYPEKAKPFAALRARLAAMEDQEARNREAKYQKMAAAQRRREGVRIGMTQEDVIASSWGRPQKINRTTTAWGTHEQWVYGGRNYLYFEDGKLTSIQN